MSNMKGHKASIELSIAQARARMKQLQSCIHEQLKIEQHCVAATIKTLRQMKDDRRLKNSSQYVGSNPTSRAGCGETNRVSIVKANDCVDAGHTHYTVDTGSSPVLYEGELIG